MMLLLSTYLVLAVTGGAAGYYVAKKRQWQAKYEDLRKAAQRAMQVLGPAAVCECAGCEWETGEAIRALKEAGIVYDYCRKPVDGPPHDPEAERRGNMLVN